MKKIYSILSLLLCGVLLASCSDKSGKGSGDTDVTLGRPINEYVDIWTTYGDTKVLQNDRAEMTASYVNLGDNLSMAMMKDETEGVQLVMTAKENVLSYELKASVLSDGNGNTIPVEQIEIFHQKYITVKRKFTENNKFAVGDSIPDMLLPMETAVEYQENTVKKGDNQSVYIDITTTEQTVPGTYMGDFKLTINGTTVDVPVCVTVWDIQCEGKSDFQSIFLVYKWALLHGEYNCSDELIRNYTETAMKYNVNIYPIQNDYPNFIDEVVEYFENDHYNTITVPVPIGADFKAYTDNGSVGGTAQKAINYIKELTMISTEEKPYIEYAVFYPSGLDEADVRADDWAASEGIFADGGEVDMMLEEAVNQLEGEGYFDTVSTEFAERVKTAIKYMPMVFTNVGFQDNAVGKYDTAVFCPLLSNFDDAIQAQKYDVASQNHNNNELWVYTCDAMSYPFPSFHTDDYNMGTRAAGWMYKHFNIDGYLYWHISQYYPSAYGHDTFIDPYEDSGRTALFHNGEGYLFYPGAKYGSENPFPSVRLVAYRDSVEDYDMICLLEDLLNEHTSKYGIERIDVNDYIADIYNTIFSGAVYYNDEALVYAARAELAKRILALQNDGVLIASAYTGAQNETTVYSNNSALKLNGITVNGTVCGDGYKYQIADMNTANGLTVEASKSNLQYAVKTVGYLHAFTDSNGIKTTENSIVNVNAGIADIVIKAVDKGDAGSNKRFVPYIQFSVNGIDSIESVSFDVENTGMQDLQFYVELVTQSGVAYKLGGVYLETGGSDSVRIFVDDTLLLDFSKVTNIRLSFANVTTDVDGNSFLARDSAFRLSNFVYDK